jgi:hypothetical protein
MTKDLAGNAGREKREMESLIARARRIASPSTPTTASAEAERQGGLVDNIRELNDNITFFRKCLSATRTVVSGLLSTIVSPVWRLLRSPVLWVVRHYLRLWNRWAYTADRDTKARKLSRARSSVVIVVSVLALSTFTTTWLGNTVRFFTIEPLVDGVLIGLSKRTEVFYLTQSDEIDPENNIHSVRGCRKRTECAEVDAAYFRVQPRLAHDIWKLWVYGNPVYVPDHIVAPIAPGLNECHVTYYGYRMTSSWIARLLRSLQLYPTMLEATCTYLGTRTSS